MFLQPFDVVVYLWLAEADVINVGPGQRYDVVWPAREPGKWLLHCHISHHTLNNNVEEQGAGGLLY